MSALHRNAWLDDSEAACLKCSAAVDLPADYCRSCTPISPSILHQIFDAPDLPEPVRLGWVEIMGAALCAMVIGVCLGVSV